MTFKAFVHLQPSLLLVFLTSISDVVESRSGNLKKNYLSIIKFQMVIPQALLDSFVHMVSPCDNTDSEINRQCAHSFPAVAFTLGRNNWHCIMGTYKQLASDVQVYFS